MKLFLDTSSLFKLYHKEADSNHVEDIFIRNKVITVFVSELAKIEFASSVWKKFRTKEIDAKEANALLRAFEKDYAKYSFVLIDSTIVEDAKQLFTKYGELGLRTFDSIQLATALILRTKADLFKTADHLLDSFFTSELLPTS